MKSETFWVLWTDDNKEFFPVLVLLHKNCSLKSEILGEPMDVFKFMTKHYPGIPTWSEIWDDEIDDK